MFSSVEDAAGAMEAVDGFPLNEKPMACRPNTASPPMRCAPMRPMPRDGAADPAATRQRIRYASKKSNVVAKLDGSFVKREPYDRKARKAEVKSAHPLAA